MNIFLNEYFGFCFELNFELNHFSAQFNEKMNFQNVSNRANWVWYACVCVCVPHTGQKWCIKVYSTHIVW